MDGPYTDEECYGPEAKEFLTDLLPKGTEVYIQQDISNKDRNGRFLRHIFIVDEETEDVYLLSEVLVLGGFAKAREYPPDDLYADILEEAQEIADREDTGLWDECAA
jgi:micrococcal nuclease